MRTLCRSASILHIFIQPRCRFASLETTFRYNQYNGCLTSIPRQLTARRSSACTPLQRDPQVAKHRTLLLEPPRAELSGPRRVRGPREEAGRGVTVAPPPASDGTLSNLPAAPADLRRIDELISRRHIDNQMRIWVSCCGDEAHEHSATFPVSKKFFLSDLKGRQDGRGMVALRVSRSFFGALSPPSPLRPRARTR